MNLAAAEFAPVFRLDFFSFISLFWTTKILGKCFCCMTWKDEVLRQVDKWKFSVLKGSACWKVYFTSNSKWWLPSCLMRFKECWARHNTKTYQNIGWNQLRRESIWRHLEIASLKVVPPNSLWTDMKATPVRVVNPSGKCNSLERWSLTLSSVFWTTRNSPKIAVWFVSTMGPWKSTRSKL